MDFVQHVIPNPENEVHEMHYIEEAKCISCTSFRENGREPGNEVHFMYYIWRKTGLCDRNAGMRDMKCPS
jgi:hypothetical protein